MVIHNFGLNKIGTEQIYGKPMSKDKISTNFKAIRLLIANNLYIFIILYLLIALDIDNLWFKENNLIVV